MLPNRQLVQEAHHERKEDVRDHDRIYAHARHQEKQQADHVEHEGNQRIHQRHIQVSEPLQDRITDGTQTVERDGQRTDPRQHDEHRDMLSREEHAADRIRQRAEAHRRRNRDQHREADTVAYTGHRIAPVMLRDRPRQTRDQ